MGAPNLVPVTTFNPPAVPLAADEGTNAQVPPESAPPTQSEAAPAGVDPVAGYVAMYGVHEQVRQATTAPLRQAAEQRPQPTDPRLRAVDDALRDGKLDKAQRALVAIKFAKLPDADKAAYTQLRDALKWARQQSYSDSFAADAAKDEPSPVNGKAAAEEAHKLVELLQKTDAVNTPEIAEARLKQANALLLGGHHREAEQAVRGIAEKQLEPEQRDYLAAIRNEIHTQRVGSLASGVDGDMKHRHYKEAASKATALVYELDRYFPDQGDRLRAARVAQATAQVMSGDLEGARTSLGRIGRDDLQQMPEPSQKQYRELSSVVHKHFEVEKKVAEMKAEQAAIRDQIKTIDTLSASGSPRDAAKAVPLAELLLATIQKKCPNNAVAIANARLTLANARFAAGDLATARSELLAIGASTKDAAVRDNVQLLLARTTLKEGRIDEAVRMLRALGASAATPEVSKVAKSVIISIESTYLKNVERKADVEQKRLWAILEDKTPQSKWAFVNPVTSIKQIGGKFDDLRERTQTKTNWLGVVGHGAALAGIVMTRNHLTLAELQAMSVQQIAALPGVGVDSANAIQGALSNVDVKVIACGDFQGKHFTWEKGTWYEDGSYLDNEMDKVAHWVGKQVGSARAIDEELMGSDSLFERAVGHVSGAILDGVSDANQFVKDSLKNAAEFYNDPARKDAWYAKLGRAGTFGGEILTSVFTMPATIVDYKATDAERAGAITGTLLMAGTMGALRAGGPAWTSLRNAPANIAASRAGQWVARSELGQMAGRVAAKAGDVASRAVQWVGETQAGQLASRAVQKIGDTAVKAEARFEATGFAQGMDKLGAGLKKLNPDLGVGSKAAPASATTGVLEVHPTMPNVMIEAGIPGLDMGRLMRELERTPGGARIAERIRDGELHVTLTREPLAQGVDGLALDNEIQITWAGSIEETASTAIHEGAHFLDPHMGADGKSVSMVSREAIARAEEYEYRLTAKLPAYDSAEEAYRNAFLRTRAAGGTIPEARLAAERDMIQVLRTDPHYGLVGSDGADQAWRIGRARPAKSVEQTVDEVLGNRSAGQFRASVSVDEMNAAREKLFDEARQQYGEAAARRLVQDMRPEAIQRRALSDRIYAGNYHAERAPKTATVTQNQLTHQLTDYRGGQASWGGWHVRVGHAGDVTGDVKRLYLNVMPDHAAELTRYLSSQLNEQGIRFNFKVRDALQSFKRADDAMLYVQSADYQAVRKLVTDYARAHPHAFAEGTPALTKPIGKGIAVAEEPAQMGLPFRPGRHSFGQAASDVMAEAIMEAPAGATREEVKALVREHLQRHGFDPDRPWLRQGSKTDNL